MRILMLAMACLLLACAIGCRRSANANSVAVNGPGITANPVGPIPGGVHDTPHSTNPYATDPVALQDGRRLFDWYNCSGCHGGHAGGGMGPSLRDPVWLYGNRDDQIFDTIVHGRSKGMPSWGTRYRRTRYGNWLHTSSQWARRWNRIRPSNLPMKRKPTRSRNPNPT
jgi:cytochrome c oxidase cbb3-type subunit 3